MNNIISVSIDRANRENGDMIYRLTIEHTDEIGSSKVSIYDFVDIYMAFSFLNTI